MSAEITMPQLSDTMSEGTLVKWVKKEGDKIRSGDVLAEIETDKATMEMEAYESGTLAHIAVKEGQKVPVGATIAILATGKESVAEVKARAGAVSAPTAAASAAGAAPAAAAAPAAHASGTPSKSVESKQSAAGSRSTGGGPSGGGVATMEAASASEIREPENVGHQATRSAPTAVPPIPSSGNGNGGRRLRISPLARRIASDRGLDLSQLHGTGPDGRIVQKDVLAYLEKPAAAPASAPAAVAPAAAAPLPPRVITPGSKEVIPLTKMRQTIAGRLQQSKQTVPHFYETIDADVEELSQLRGRLNHQLESQNVRLGVGDFIAKAVAVALKSHPALNATFDPQKMEITRHGSVNLGMAVALPDGLIVPVLRSIEQLGLKEIRQRTADLVDRARKQRLKQDEMTGATFSVSNLGSYGVREFSAIINPPEVAILAIAAAEKRPVVRNDTIVARTMMSLTLSVDHRAVDGATAAEFLRTLKQLLEEPAMMLV